jgi:hypothetical protein
VLCWLRCVWLAGPGWLVCSLCFAVKGDLYLYQKEKEKGGINNLGNIMFNKLAIDITKAIDTVDKWSSDRSFFHILSAHDRKLELENMHIKVMSSIQKNLAIASLSVLLDVHATQATIIEQGVEMKSLLTASIKSVQGRLLPKVRAEVVEQVAHHLR